LQLAFSIIINYPNYYHILPSRDVSPSLRAPFDSRFQYPNLNRLIENIENIEKSRFKTRWYLAWIW